MQMMYTIARYYSTSENMSRLLNKMTNQVGDSHNNYHVAICSLHPLMPHSLIVRKHATPD